MKNRRVALRKESVDRNSIEPVSIRVSTVALRKESVDRNVDERCKLRRDNVALRKESVDRNIILPLPVLLPISSLSARRAWIEMRLA